MFKQETDFSDYRNIAFKLRKMDDKYLLSIIEKDTINQSLVMLWMSKDNLECIKFAIEGEFDND